MTTDEFPRRYARRLLERLDLPAEAARVLSHPRYWTPEVCALYCDACDERLPRDPEAALAMARLAPLLAQRLIESPRKRDLTARALAVLADAHRANGALLEADGIFRTAFEIAVRARVDTVEEAGVYRRYAAFLLDLGRPALATTMAQQAVDLLKGEVEKGGLDLGLALLQRGVVRLHLEQADGAVDDLGLCLALVGPEHHAFDRALKLLDAVAGNSGELSVLHRARRHLESVRRRLDGERHRPTRERMEALEGRWVARCTGAANPQSAPDCVADAVAPETPGAEPLRAVAAGRG